MEIYEAVESLTIKFKSGNDIPVERNTITFEEWDAIREFIQDKQRLPIVSIDKDALRFEFRGEGHNMFWVDLFRSNRDFQNELANNLFKAYNECVVNNKEYS
jgi:hypothetical protein